MVTAADLARIIMANPSCYYCNYTIEMGHGSFDHVIAFERGGRNTTDNIVRACLTCNRIKHTKTPEEFAAYQSTIFRCDQCGRVFRPRFSDWKNGNGRFCSRACSASSRW